jgi:membrane-associated protease RseP (regulator of RpoE activity)
MTFPEIEILTSLVSRVFRVEDVTRDNPQRGMLVRYRGKLLGSDSAAAYDQLAESLRPHHLTALFRNVDGRQTIYIAPARPDPKPAKVSVNILLFVLTVFSVMLAGSLLAGSSADGPPPADALGQILFIFRGILSGWPFAASLLGILVAHEFGHYLMSRRHSTAATLPYFIPFPFSPLGTMGAFISMQAVPRNKRILFDIGVAGPLAGLVVAVPVLLLGLALSSVGEIEASPGGFLEGNSLLYLLAKFAVFGQFLPAPTEPQGLLYWLRYFFTGQPIPFGGLDVFIHPVAFAGWAGLLVTALNLLPVGTLDGGHAIYALFGENARKAFPAVMVVLLLLGTFWNGWWMWAVLLLWLGRVHAEPLDQITTLDAPRRALAVLMLIIFLLVFSPVPFMPLTQ